MKNPVSQTEFLACERRSVYQLLMLASGMMGAYTFNLRGGVFCNAQTANVLMMSVAFGNRQWAHALYYLIPISAYFMGAFLSELLPSPVKKFGLLRWDTCLVAFEALVLFCVGFIPLSVPHQVVQVTINFICSMQYNTFRQAQGVPMATTFCTNHVRQTGIALAKFLRKGDRSALSRGKIHLQMLLCFMAGAFLLTASCTVLQEKSIWLALLPLLINFGFLAHADLTQEKELLTQVPSGH